MNLRQVHPEAEWANHRQAHPAEWAAAWEGPVRPPTVRTASATPKPPPPTTAPTCAAPQTTDANGIAQFTTIFPGWYMGRTTHIHVKVHIDKKTVLTSQTFFDETLLDESVLAVPVQRAHRS